MLRRERKLASSSSVGASVNEEFLTRLRSFVRRRVPSTADADDLVQTVLLRLVKSNKDLTGGTVHRWLYEVARNAIADYYRSPRNGTGLEDSGELPDGESPESAGLVECIQPLLRTLPVEDRKLLARVDIDGVSQAEIAREAGIPRSSVKSRVQRARARLRSAVLASCVTDWDAAGRPMGPARCKASPSPDCGCG